MGYLEMGKGVVDGDTLTTSFVNLGMRGHFIFPSASCLFPLKGIGVQLENFSLDLLHNVNHN
jgi:hypothetical protein